MCTKEKLALVIVLVFAFPQLAVCQSEEVDFASQEMQPLDLNPTQLEIIQALMADPTATSRTLLRSRQGEASGASVLSFGLPENEIARFIREERILTEDGVFWRGRDVEARAAVDLYFPADDGVSGSLILGDRLYSIHEIGDGLSVLIERDRSKLPREHPEEPAEGPPEAEDSRRDLPPGDAPTSADDTTVVGVDVLLLYTAEVDRRHVSMMQRAQKLVAMTNRSFVRSAIPVVLGLAGVEPLNESESGHLMTDLRRAKSSSHVQDLRDDTEADLVFVLVSRGDAAGWAFRIRADEGSAFAIADDDYADWYFTFPHEIGHLFGARHDPDADPAPPPWAHGYCLGQEAWRTIMSYQCVEDDRRIGFWSNPQVEYQGAPVGTSDFNDNARLLRQRRFAVAGFR